MFYCCNCCFQLKHLQYEEGVSLRKGVISFVMNEDWFLFLNHALYFIKPSSHLRTHSLRRRRGCTSKLIWKSLASKHRHSNLTSAVIFSTYWDSESIIGCLVGRSAYVDCVNWINKYVLWRQWKNYVVNHNLLERWLSQLGSTLLQRSNILLLSHLVKQNNVLAFWYRTIHNEKRDPLPIIL